MLTFSGAEICPDRNCILGLGKDVSWSLSVHLHSQLTAVQLRVPAPVSLLAEATQDFSDVKFNEDFSVLIFSEPVAALALLTSLSTMTFSSPWAAEGSRLQVFLLHLRLLQCSVFFHSLRVCFPKALSSSLSDSAPFSWATTHGFSLRADLQTDLFS